MKKYLLLSLVLLTIVACKKNNDNAYTISDIAQVTSFKLKANDTIPGWANAKFVIEERSDTGLIEVLDSLQYGTPLQAVVPSITFYTTPGTVRFMSPEDTISFTGSGTDTIDLTKRPLRLVVYASDLTHSKWYEVNAYAHQVNPMQFSWKQLKNAIGLSGYSEQRAMHFGEKFLYFCNNGLDTKLYSAQNPNAWSEEQLTGLPGDCRVSTIIQKGDMLYYADSVKLYSSHNGKDWDNATINGDFQVHSLLMDFNNEVWAIGQKDGHYQLGILNSEGAWQVLEGIFPGDTLPEDFPVNSFSVVNFTSSSNYPHAIVAGGYNSIGEMLNATWSFEYNNGYRIVNYTSNTTDAFANVGLMWYDDMVWRIGGIDSKGEFFSQVQYSKDEGLHWENIDSDLCPLESLGYTQRQAPCVFVYSKNVYILGGRDRTSVYSDLYQGRINEIDFLKK